MTAVVETELTCPSWCDQDEKCFSGEYDDRPMLRHTHTAYANGHIAVAIDVYAVSEGFLDPPGIMFVRGDEAMHWLTADEAGRLGEQLQVAAEQLRAIETEGFEVLP